MPPFIGQGMNSGLRDAGNLAWKIAMVLRGQASDKLLKTYSSERQPNCEYITVRCYALCCPRAGSCLRREWPSDWAKLSAVWMKRLHKRCTMLSGPIVGPHASYPSHRADVEYSKGTASRAWPRPWYLDQITGSGPVGFPKKDSSGRQRGLPRLFAGSRLADLIEQGRSGPILKREEPQDFKDYPQRSYATCDKRRGRHGRVWPMVRRKED